MSVSQDIPALVRKILTQQLQIQLQPADMAFLAALRFWKDTESQPEFSEDELHVVHQTVDCTLPDNLADSRQRRCNEAIRRLLEQHLLICLEGGEHRSHAYLVTPLAEQIIDSVNIGLEASQIALSTLFMTVSSHLTDIRNAAAHGGNDPFWKLQIEAPLDITVSQLITAIDHRQRQLDKDAIQTRSQVVELLKQDWQNAMSRCEELLTSTQARLQDLQKLLLASCHELRHLLEAIAKYSELYERYHVVSSVLRLEQHLDRIEHWSSERLEHWETFHHRVHQYLRQFINMDERKALIERTLDGIQNYQTLPWYLQCVSEDNLTRLRDIHPPSQIDHRAQIIHEEGAVTDIEDIDALRTEVRLWLQQKVNVDQQLPSYEKALANLAQEWPIEKLPLAAGWLFEAMTQLGHQQDQKTIPDHHWHEIIPEFEAESLSLDRNPQREKTLANG
ncbi:hypothetical protein ACH42_16890 [Endozoicomonas sp. (ex Bugula neritina AB1)]|nr:hypothetical protein ACH42_16890 [Endozoicomonas sp. (ex Bugula neritina AB1)]